MQKMKVLAQFYDNLPTLPVFLRSSRSLPPPPFRLKKTYLEVIFIRLKILQQSLGTRPCGKLKSSVRTYTLTHCKSLLSVITLVCGASSCMLEI